MLNQAHTLRTVLILTLGILASAGTAVAHQQTTSELLLPYFEVDLSGTGSTTFFSVVNVSTNPVPIVINVHSNWGVEILRSSITLAGNEARTIQLGDWLIHGKLPERQLADAQLDHCQAALSGLRTPGDELYYASQLQPGRAVGYVTIRSRMGTKVLFGDYFQVDGGRDEAQGEVLVDIASGSSTAALCKRHGLRYLADGALDNSTEVVIWTGRRHAASDSPYFPERRKILADLSVYKQSGELIDRRSLDVLPLQVLKISDLGLDVPIGWLDFTTDQSAFVTVRYSSRDRFSAGLQASCLPSPASAPRSTDESSPVAAALQIETTTNNVDADTGLGPDLRVGDVVSWFYLVRNVGDVELTDITVSDDQMGLICRRDALGPGLAVTCETQGFAEEGAYANVGSVNGRAPTGETVSASDSSHYFGKIENEHPRIDLELAANGLDDDAGPGPAVSLGDKVNWTFVVRNTGDVELLDVTVEDEQLGIVCKVASLMPGASETCRTTSVAQAGQYSTLGMTTGLSPGGQSVSDSDRGHYFAPF